MLDLTLRVTVILGAAWLIARALPRASAATRHLVWHCALMAVLAAPLLAPFAPKVPMVPMVPMVPEVPQVLGVAQVPDELQLPRAHDGKLAAGTAGPLGTVGALGTLGTSLWFLLGWLSAARTVRRAQPAPAAWQVELTDLCSRFRLEDEVRVRIVTGATSPLAITLWRSTILLPALAEAWSAERRRAVLLHELAHIRRGDGRAQLVTQAACALYWFNPLVWIAAAHLRRERERACDDEVLQSGTPPSAYAAHLLEIARQLRPALGPSAALAMARPSQLEGRLLSVLAAHAARRSAPATRWAVALLTLLTTAVALGASPRHESPQVQVAQPSGPAFGITSAILEEAARVEAPAEGVASHRQALTHRSQDVREKAALSLAFMSGSEVVPALIGALQDSDAQVREKAAIGLALRRDERVVEPLLGAMRDPDAQVREKAAIALGSSGDTRARAALTTALHDPDAQVREKAAAGLILLGLVR